MTDPDKAAFLDRLTKAVAAAAGRGLRITGYAVQGDHVRYDFAPAKTRRMVASEQAALRDALRESTTTRKVIRRGVQQGTLL